MVDDQDIDRALSRLNLNTKLFPKRGKHRRTCELTANRSVGCIRVFVILKGEIEIALRAGAIQHRAIDEHR